MSTTIPTRPQTPTQTRTPKNDSKVERAKKESRRLRGTISEVLASDQPAFEHDDLQLLKFHGIYQQDDRDARKTLRATGRGKEYSFMIRTRVPGGRLSAQQFLDLEGLADRVTYNRSIRITSRQTFQFHGVLKGALKSTMADLNASLVTTLAACGDVGRNVMASTAPLPGGAHRAVLRLAEDLGQALLPQTGAYHEIWLDGEKVAGGETEDLYGDRYLPRKFKTAVALPQDNSVDVFTQDVGLIAVVDGEGGSAQVRGVNLLVGGGLGMTHRKADTFARLGTPLGFVRVEHAATAVREIAAIFRDHGNRGDRRHARLKYLVEEWGIDVFRYELLRRSGLPLEDWVEVGPVSKPDLLGVHPQDDGLFFFGLFVQNGRLVDGDRLRLKTAVRKVVETFGCDLVLTPDQNLLFCDLQADDLDRLQAILKAYGYDPAQPISGARRHSLACPALPTCGLALAESERFFPDLLEELEDALGELGLEGEAISVRMTGCPNGCSRPYTADIGLVGRGPGRYDIFVGGRLAGDRLADLYAENVPAAELALELRPLLEAWARYRRDDEAVGDFYQRAFGVEPHRTRLTGAKETRKEGVGEAITRLATH